MEEVPAEERVLKVNHDGRLLYNSTKASNNPNSKNYRNSDTPFLIVTNH